MIDAYEDEDSLDIDARLQSRFDRAMASTPIMTRRNDENDDSVDSDRTRRASFSRSPTDIERSVTNRLFYDADRQRRTKMKMKLAMEQNESPRRPKISSYAKTLQREKGDIGTRLYEAGRKQRERKMEARRRSSVASSTSGFVPVQASSTISKEKRSKLGEDLYRRARASQLEKQRKIEAAEMEAKDNARPKLNKRSMRLASGRSTFERLSERPKRGLDVDVDSDLTFRPRIDAKSKSMSQRRDGGLSGTRRLERLFADESRVRKKVEKMRLRLQEKELAECTFEPKFLNKSRHKIKTRTMLHRSAEWQKKRDEKIKRLREKRSVVHDDECTFTPKVGRNKAVKKMSRRNNNEPSREVEGVTESIVFRMYDMLNVPQAEEQLMFKLRSCDEKRTGLVTCEAFLRCVRSQRVYMSLDQEVVLVELLKEEGGGKDEEWISYIDLKNNVTTLQEKLREKQTQKLKDVETIHPGIDRFLKRQERARELQKARREIPHCDGKSWTGKVTKPRAPRLHESKRRFKMKQFLESSSSIGSSVLSSRKKYVHDVERMLRRGKIEDRTKVEDEVVVEEKQQPAVSSRSRSPKKMRSSPKKMKSSLKKMRSSPKKMRSSPTTTTTTTSRRKEEEKVDRVERWARRVFSNAEEKKKEEKKVKKEEKTQGMFTRVEEDVVVGRRGGFYPKSSTRRAETDFDRRLREIREKMQ